MEYSNFKALQFFLFFGAVFAFGAWQLISVRRDLRRSRQHTGESAEYPHGPPRDPR